MLLQIWSLQARQSSTDQASTALTLTERAELGCFSHWTMAGSLCSAGPTAVAAVGLSDNSVQAFWLDLERPDRFSCTTWQCTEHSLLYSMALLPQQVIGRPMSACCSRLVLASHRRQIPVQPGLQGSAAPGAMLVAAGTIFLDVLVWGFHMAGGGSPPASARCDVPPLLRCKGHEGSIHRSARQLCHALSLAAWGESDT